MKRVAIIQARMGSTRLPGKVLMPLGGLTVLGCVVDRLSRCRRLDAIVVATSVLAADDAVAQEATRLGAQVTRGSADDVLARFAAAAQEASAQVIVRITSDCPLIDPDLVDAMLGAFENQVCDYLSNTVKRTFPRGLDTEIFTDAALNRALRDAHEPYQREHVTPYFYQHPELFAIRQYTDVSGADRAQMRWTLDTPEDYAFLSAVYAACAHTRPSDVRTADVLRALECNSGLADVNRHVRQKGLGQ